uniref:Uncharacterized protein n=1 Tax=Lepeophtheirus salmonis TaxID=72036 RepID=A0A0K2UN68_LEPSM
MLNLSLFFIIIILQFIICAINPFIFEDHFTKPLFFQLFHVFYDDFFSFKQKKKNEKHMEIRKKGRYMGN